MNSSRTHYSRKIQYDAANLTFDGAKALQTQILALLTRRENPQSLKRIQTWFSGVSQPFILAQINILLESEQIRIVRTSMGRRQNAAYRYEVKQ